MKKSPSCVVLSGFLSLSFLILFIYNLDTNVLPIYENQSQEFKLDINILSIDQKRPQELTLNMNVLPVIENQTQSNTLDMNELSINQNHPQEFTLEERIHLEKIIFGEKNILQDDVNMVKYIRKYHLIPPPAAKIPVKYGSNPSQFEKILKKLFENKNGGFFIECGANDGLFFSNTIALEQKQNWTGLLIEADSIIFEKLAGKNRNAWLSNVCLAKDKPVKMELMHHNGKKNWNVGNSRLRVLGDKGNDSNYRMDENGNMIDMTSLGFINCFPLYSILLAIQVREIDYFSLDIEGYEFEVVKGIPFELVKIKVLSIEHYFIPEGKQALVDFMSTKNYQLKYETVYEGIFVLNES